MSRLGLKGLAQALRPCLTLCQHAGALLAALEHRPHGLEPSAPPFFSQRAVSGNQTMRQSADLLPPLRVLTMGNVHFHDQFESSSFAFENHATTSCCHETYLFKICITGLRAT
jgi:hypothetical protein